MARNGTVAQQQHNNIWHQMSYTPPRGPCSQKSSILTSCPCYRFMLHPLKGATSFECDGCGHHASFHKMDNEQDEETEKLWKQRKQIQDATHMCVVSSLGLENVKAATQNPQQGRIANGGNESSDDGLQIVDRVTEVRPQSRKRQRIGGR